MRNYWVKPGTACSFQHDTTVKKRLKFIVENIKYNNNLIILDVGTGEGIYMYYLSSRAKLCVGIDTDDKSLRKARKTVKTKNTEFILMQAESLAFKDNTFDVITMIEVLEHVADDKKVIKEIYRVLKPGGQLIITAPNKLFPFETHGFKIGSRIYGTKGLGFPFLTYLPQILRKHVATARVYTPWQLKRMLESQGFIIRTVEFLSPSLDQLKLNFPKLRWFIDKFQNLVIKVEKFPIFKNFLTTIIVCAEKVER